MGGALDNTEQGWDAIREAQRTLPARVPHTSVVSAVDLTIGDSVHLDSPSLVRLGRRLAHVAVTHETGPNVGGVSMAGAEAHGLWRIRVACMGVTAGWTPSTHLPGFRLCDEHGSSVPGLGIIEARPDPADPTSIELTTTAWTPAELSGVHVAYGLGYDPVCIAVDGADLPLPAFAPLPIVTAQGSD